MVRLVSCIIFLNPNFVIVLRKEVPSQLRASSMRFWHWIQLESLEWPKPTLLNAMPTAVENFLGTCATPSSFSATIQHWSQGLMSLTPELSLMELPVNVKVCCNLSLNFSFSLFLHLSFSLTPSFFSLSPLVVHTFQRFSQPISGWFGRTWF